VSKLKRAIDAHHNVRGVELPARSAKREDGKASRHASEEAPRPVEPLRDTHVGYLDANRGEHDDDYVKLVLSDGKLKQLLKRTRKEQTVFHDWVSVTLGVRAYLLNNKRIILTDDDVARAVSYDLTQIFGEGFAISIKNGYGMHFYKESYVIGQKWGIFCVGHRSDRMLISISGEGWLHAPDEAASRLYEWLCHIDQAGGRVSISRIDLAVDIYENGPTHESFQEAYSRGDFVRQRRHLGTPDCWPHYQVFGCVHTKRGRDKGITDAIGVRTGDLYLRRYDKGKAEGDPESTWVRVELEMKSKDTVIPLDILLRPEAYFCQYPWLEMLQKSFAERITTRERRAEINVEDAKRIIKVQFGKYLRVLRELADSGDELLEELQSDDDKWPARLAKLVPEKFTGFHSGHRVKTYVFENEEHGSEIGPSEKSENNPA
jgi:phage replication initiation protein